MRVLWVGRQFYSKGVSPAYFLNVSFCRCYFLFVFCVSLRVINVAVSECTYANPNLEQRYGLVPTYISCVGVVAVVVVVAVCCCCCCRSRCLRLLRPCWFHLLLLLLAPKFCLFCLFEPCSSESLSHKRIQRLVWLLFSCSLLTSTVLLVDRSMRATKGQSR